MPGKQSMGKIGLATFGCLVVVAGTALLLGDADAWARLSFVYVLPLTLVLWVAGTGCILASLMEWRVPQKERAAEDLG